MYRSSRPPLPTWHIVCLAGLLAGCGDSIPTFETTDPTFARGGNNTPDPVVSDVDPNTAPQDTTLDIRVFGANFEDGSTVTIKRGGRAAKEIVTNLTTFVNPGELIANITIALDADTGAYDVEVLTLSKRKGVGTALFAVLQSRNGPSSNELLLSGFAGFLSANNPNGTVAAEFTGDGRIWANTENGGKKTVTELCLDLSMVGGEGILDDFHYGEFVGLVAADPSSSGMERVCTVVTMHTRDHSNGEGKAAGQEPLSIEHSGGKIVLKDFQTQKKVDWEWRLIWDVAGTDATDPDRGLGVCIHRSDLDTWHVYNDDDVLGETESSCAARDIDVDNVAELWRLVPGARNAPPTWVHVAEFEFPFRFTATRP